MDFFPKPLTLNEEQKYLNAYKNGDISARNILIEHNLRLVAHVVKKYQTLEKDPDDLLSIGTIGLIKAIQTFNPNKNCRLATYAIKCIENELLMMIRAEKRKINEVSIYDPIGVDKEGNQINLIDVIGQDSPEPIDDICHNEILLNLRKILPQVLTPREYEIISLRYGLDSRAPLTQRELASRLNISRSYISRIEKKALEKLREALE